MTIKPPSDIPDWAIPNIAIALSHPDKLVRQVAHQYIEGRLELLLIEACQKRMGRLLGSMIPQGLKVFPDQELLRRIRPEGKMHRRDIDMAAEMLSEEDAEYFLAFAIEEWAELECERIQERWGGQAGDIEGMLRSALHDLKHAARAAESVEVWVGFSAPPPPDWAAVVKLIAEDPRLLKIGPAKMLKQGYVPPPWVTAVMT